MLLKCASLCFDGRVYVFCIFGGGRIWVNLGAKHFVCGSGGCKVLNWNFVGLYGFCFMVPSRVIVWWKCGCGAGVCNADSAFGCIDTEFCDN